MINRSIFFLSLIFLVDSGCSFSPSTPSVSVWDNVLISDDCEDLHRVAKLVGLGHRMFTRPIISTECNLIVRAVDSILSEMGDESKVVEYWTRQEWRSIEAHADVDEFLAKSQDATGNTNTSDYRYPKNGHVLYLKIGTEVRGPTLVFPKKRSAKDLLQKTRHDSNKKESIDLMIVPAVGGRLLRFPGEALHAVPRPADHWLLKYVQGAAKYEPEEQWGRSVILFNTWDDAPMNVPQDTSTEEETKSLRICKDNWKSKFDFISDHSRDKEESHEKAETITAKIWLLGNFRRRAHTMRTLKVAAPAWISASLNEVNDVSHLLLEPTDQ